LLSKKNVTRSNCAGAVSHPAKIVDTVMDPFSYLVVLTSIILGLGVTRLVGGLGYLMQTRRRKHPYWVHMLWMVNLLLAMAIVWWVAYRWRSNEHWTFLLFIWLLLLPTILYLISSLLFPDQDDEPITDWQVYFYENHRDIFLLYALVFPIDIVDTLLKGMAHFKAQGLLYVMTMGLWFVLCLVAAFTKRRMFHASFAVIFLICNLVFVGTTLLTDQGVIGGTPR
jgi:hypothetical protein